MPQRTFTSLFQRTSGRHLSLMAGLLALVLASGFHKAKGPRIAFRETDWSFGSVLAGEPVRYRYAFTNTGDAPLLIREATGSCTCILTDWPKDPVAPHGKGSISVLFNTAGKAGKQEKTVVVYSSDARCPQTILRLSGEVRVPEHLAAPFDSIRQTAH